MVSMRVTYGHATMDGVRAGILSAKSAAFSRTPEDIHFGARLHMHWWRIFQQSPCLVKIMSHLRVRAQSSTAPLNLMNESSWQSSPAQLHGGIRSFHWNDGPRLDPVMTMPALARLRFGCVYLERKSLAPIELGKFDILPFLKERGFLP
jgi:hypothetical protein